MEAFQGLARVTCSSKLDPSTVDPHISEPQLSKCSDYPKCMILQLHHLKIKQCHIPRPRVAQKCLFLTKRVYM